MATVEKRPKGKTPRKSPMKKECGKKPTGGKKK